MSWSETFVRAYSGLPADYLTFDCETTGLQSTDLPLEIGHVIVREGEIVNRGSFLLDWSRSEEVEEAWLQWRIDEVNSRITSAGEEPAITLARLQKEGVEPRQALKFYLELFRDNRAAGAKLVGQNAVCFDVPLLANAFESFLGQKWYPMADEIYDTLGLAKARHNDLTPRTFETLIAYMRRAARSYAAGRSFGLAKLAEYYGVMADCDAAFHTAAYDAYVTTLVYEKQRACFEGCLHVTA